ncbi:MAG TPA: hypothetical protein VM282_11845 [Acidimicrobiales bacterium]|nr:hypothetical protein [Acidimicrobiales bacterium]
METRTPRLPAPVYSAPPSFAPNSWDQRSNRRDFGFAGGAVVAIVAIVAACIAMVAGREPLGPSQWDARVAPLVTFVEEARGHKFAYPVFVEFLTAEEYRAQATGGAPVSAEAREYYAIEARTFRSLGLIGGNVDLAAEQDEIRDSGTLAYYSPSRRTVYVRGVELTPSLRLTLVHELTHALQDQVFNLDLSRTQSDGAAFALRALAEGDAIRIENEYYDTLSEDEQAQVDNQAQIDRESSKALNSESAPVLLALFGAPYDLGIPFVRLLASIEGELDRAFRSPPQSEENIFDPASFLDDDIPVRVEAPKPPKGAKSVPEMGTEVGAVMWYLLVASHTDQKQAIEAVDGWGGDAMTVYERDDVLCTAMVFRGDTPGDADEMHVALNRVVTALARHTPQLSREASDVTLTLCDPGPSAAPKKIDASAIFAAPTVRSLLLGIALDDPAVTPRQAGCAAGKTIAGLDEARMVQLLEAQSADDPLVRQVLAELGSAIEGCR